ncbi:protein Daple isoform X2 [Phyllopteryx taeniolatus]|uniref:protein Daple isoform X2 n=1 Tax=Phyllopteryx taeniolatus TaxID=161469 RepID=UPI002AD1F8FC|nr:protein Daple isoform X2 [Phyllopteryx taeniolatus]
MDGTLSELLAAFLESPLVLWVRTLGPLGSSDDAGSEERVNMFVELVDGVFLHKIMTHIDPSPNNQRLNKNVNNDVSLRLHNLTLLTRHIRTYYQDTLQQLILMPLPNILCIARDPLSAKSMEELKRILLLILGCAVQCERKEEMIERIKLLDIETQAAIVSHIQEVTHNQQNVLDLSWLEEGTGLAQEELKPLSRSMATSLQQLIAERDKASEVIVDLTQERDYLSSLNPQERQISSPEQVNTSGGLVVNNKGSALTVASLTKEEKQHLSVELADTKAKLRRYRQELEEKVEQLMDSKHEVEHLDQELQRLKQENQSLSCEARSVRVYRDEVDSLREKAARVDRLETELTRCKEKLNDVHFYKTRVEELREDTLTLMETKVLLEEQLSVSRGRCEKVHAMEKDNLLLRAKINDLEMERDSERRRLEELVEENMLLEIGQKQSMNESAHLGWELEQLTKNQDNSNSETRKSFVHELNECVSSRVLKLEKENRELQTSIERLKEENHHLQEKQLHTQELDRENQGLGKKLEHLRVLLDQEKLTNQDMESLGDDLLKEKQNLEREMHALRAEKDRQISELESEKQRLSDAVVSLRERAQSHSETRVREVEAENRLLHQGITDTSARLASLETQLMLYKEEAERLRERAARCDEVERELVRVERNRDALNREVTSLRACSESSEFLEKQVSSLEQEVHRFKREAVEAQQGLQQLKRQEANNSLLTKENLELRCSVENLRSSSSFLIKQQEQYKEAQKKLQEMQKTLDEVGVELQGERKRGERLEMNVATLNQEKHRLEEDMEKFKEEKAELEREKQQILSRQEELMKVVEDLCQEQRRREEGDKERRKILSDLEQSEKGRKHLEKESWRNRMLLEGKEAELEEKASQLAVVEKKGVDMRKEINMLKEVAVKDKELERENKELNKQATIDKRALVTLREELVSEKLRVQQHSVELERLNEELEKVGLNRERLLQQEHMLEDSKYKLLESRLEETVQQAMKIKEGKISSLEKKLEECNTHNATLRTELATALQKVSTFRQQQEREENHNSRGCSRGDGRRESATAELLRIKDHLIEVEKNNASLQTQSSLLKEQLKQLENQNSSLNNQMATLQRHTTMLQEQNSALHTKTAQLQVENSTLSSQSASLMAQNAVLQGQVTALETEVESWQRQREEAWRGRESVLNDHERLLSVHERQAHEYEHFISQHTALKVKQRTLESEHRTMYSKYCTLLQQKEKWEEIEGRGQKEREELNQEHQKNLLLQQENLQLKADVDRMSQSESQKSEQCNELHQQMNELKSSFSTAQLEMNRWMTRYDSLMEQHQGLELTMTKLDNHRELLSRLKGNLEEENHHLLSQINILSQQNHTLLEKSMESKELYHQEQKLYIDKLNALRRQKEKLEEKIMDQYKFYDPTPKKRSQWSGAKALAKLIKPRKESSREQGGDRDKESANEREWAKSAPDIPLPAPPPLLPPETPPPGTHRTGSDSWDNGHTHSKHNKHSNSPILGLQSPALTPISRAGLTDRGREVYRCGTPGGSSESVNGGDGQALTHKALCSTPTHRSSSLALSSCSTQLGQGTSCRPKGVVFDEDTERICGPRGHIGGRPGSADFSHHTSSSNSPVNCKDASDCHLRSASLSSDDVRGLSESQQTLSRSATLPYDHAPQWAQPQHGGGNRSSARPSSPGSELVTLEEFLQESKLKSPQMVSTGSREDLMTEYFTRSPSSSDPTSRDQLTPTSYVTPTVHASNQRPGQSVKPSSRQPVGQSQTSGRPPTQRINQSLSRTFSLASADLLRSNGPDGFHGNGGSPNQSDVAVRRQGGGANGRERPLSARLSSSTNQQRDNSILNSPVHHLSSLTLHTERYVERERDRGRTPVSHNGPSSSFHHRGEVAMVTPVRVVPAAQLGDALEHGEVLREERAGDISHQKKDSERVRCSSAERPKSTPASPDPNNDSQTVWYEYGCV